MRPPWFLVSKPLRPPFRDGTLVYCRSFLQYAPANLSFTYLGDPTQALRDGPRDEIIEASTMGYAPSLLKKGRLLLSLFHPLRRRQALHFFFTPNPLTSSALRLLRAFSRQRPMLQTLTSSHQIERRVSLLEPLDAVVALSLHTRDRLVEAGLPPQKVHCIYPSVPWAPPIEGIEQNRCALYAGDLDLAVADRIIALARALCADDGLDEWTLLLACRPKARQDQAARQRLRQALRQPIQAGRVLLRGEVPCLDDLLAQSALQLFLADHLAYKVDLPFALLEGLARGLGLISLDVPPVNELFLCARERELEIGVAVEPGDTQGLVEAILGALRAEQRRLDWSVGARTLAQACFSPATMWRHYLRLYQHLQRRPL